MKTAHARVRKPVGYTSQHIFLVQHYLNLGYFLRKWLT